MMNFENITTEASVKIYKAAAGVFSALLHEIRELSKKKPDATLSGSKVNLVNNVLNDLMTILASEPEGKYLKVLEDDTLPQVSDALMMMVQFEAALNAFKGRYYQYIKEPGSYSGEHYWITEEKMAEWDAEGSELWVDDDD